MIFDSHDYRDVINLYRNCRMGLIQPVDDEIRESIHKLSKEMIQEIDALTDEQVQQLNTKANFKRYSKRSSPEAKLVKYMKDITGRDLLKLVLVGR